jgi:hypothetical protein
MAMPNILRTRAAAQKVGVGKTYFLSDFALKDDNDPFVPGTDDKVRRVRPIALGERAIGFFEDELDALVEGLRRCRDSGLMQRPKELERLRVGRDAWRERVNSTAE